MMSDDLVKRLHDRRVCSPAQNSCCNDYVLNQAADCIEELEAKLATCEKYKAAYTECDRIGTQAVRDLEAKLASVIAAYRIEAMRREDYSHEAFDQHIAELKGQDDE